MVGRLVCAVAGVLAAVGYSTPGVITSRDAACDEVEARIATVYALTKKRETEWDAWQNLYGLFETAQLRSCKVQTSMPPTPMLGEQSAHFNVAGKELECVKPNGVRVYTAIRDLSKYPGDESTLPDLPNLIKARQVYILSFPPRGPTIVVDKPVSNLPDIVQEFLYARACEAHRHGLPLRPGGNFGYAQSGEYNCAAIKRLRKSGMTSEQFAVILEFAAANQFGPYAFFARRGRESIQWEEMFKSCYQSDQFHL